MAAVVFDLDGVLVDSERVWVEAIREALHACGIAAGWSTEEYRGLVGMRGDEWSSELVQRYGLDAEPARFRNDVEERLRHAAGRLDPLPGALHLVTSLSGTYRLGVASSSSAAFVDAALRAIGVRSAFEALISADDVERSKPAPDVYLRAIEALGVNPSTAIAIEDSPAGIASAVDAGMRVIALGDHPPAGCVTPVSSLEDVTPALVAAMLKR